MDQSKYTLAAMILLVILLLCGGVGCHQDGGEQLQDLNYRCARDQATVMESVLITQNRMERHEEEMKTEIKRHEEEMKAEIKSLTMSMDIIHRMQDRIERQEKDHDEMKAGIKEIIQNQQEIISQMSASKWIVIQRRVDGEISFDRSWAEYEEGFGDVKGSFWIGLEKLHNLTNHSQYDLHVDITHFNGSSFYADYTNFRIGSKAEDYKIHVDNYSGTAGDALDNHNGMKFTARDKDNDNSSHNHCGRRWKSGWWFNNCFEANLNGVYYEDPNQTPGKWEGIIWVRNKKLLPKSLKFAQMKIRPI